MKSIYNYLFLFVTIILVIYLLNAKTNNKEQFIPGVKKMYRPYLRTYRLYINNKWNSIINKLNIIAKKFSIW